jgi:hypothetical protein
MLLDEILPGFDFHEAHDRFVPAPAERTYEAAKAVTSREIRLLGPLMALRTLPATLLRRRVLGPSLGTPAIDQFVRAGFAVLGERPGEELVLGAIGRFWSLSGNQPLDTVRTRADFESFAEPGYVKAAFNLVVASDGAGSRVTTETRIAGSDARATARFRRYWIVIRAPSGAIRHSWLNAIRRRATES